ncbi:MAG: PKD domain-containing protein [Methanomicrobium sp.]|nr:PKD domain-containing protein [Methanomicrobium sp.]
MKLSRSDSYYNSPSRTDDGTSRGLLCSSAGAVRASSKISRAIILSGILLIFLLAFAVVPVYAASVTVTASPDGGKVGTEIKFNAEANDLGENETVTSWEWSGGDGITGTGGSSITSSITHTFKTAGSFTVTAKANVKDSNTDEVSTPEKSVTVTITDPTPQQPQLKADFKADKTSGDAPLTVKFADNSTGATSWKWDFGDGNTSIAPNPEYTYKYSGTYTVTLKVGDGSGNSATSNPTTITVKATATTAPTTQPNATATVDKTGTVNVTLTPGKTWSDFLKLDFAASVSYGGATYLWDFGDGKTDSSKSGTHSYNDPGTYTVTLTAKPMGNSIIKNPTVTNTVKITEPTLDPKMSVETVAGTYQIKYEDTTGIPDAYVKSRLWEFGDDGTSTAKSGTYTYNSSGTKTVKLTITTTGNAKKTVSQNVKISGITAKFSASPTSGAAPLEVKFTDNSVRNSKTNSEIDYWKWEFGDGTTVTDKPNPTHTFKEPGEYTVKLTVQDKDNSQDSTEMKIKVLDNGDYPTADFGISSSSSLSGNAPLKVSFVDKSTVSSDTKANITAWYWKITDSSDKLVASFSTQNPTYTFEDGGKYTVALTVTDSKSRTNTKTVENYITVTSGLSATFTASPTSGTAPLNVRFEATPDPDNAYDIDEYAWNFGDGTGVSYGRVISHVYQSAGTYTVKMTVTDEKSKTYTATRSNYITVTAGTSSKTVAPTATTTVSSTGTDTALKSKQISKGDRIFGIPGTQPIRSEMQRMYGFFDDFFTLFFGMFGK